MRPAAGGARTAAAAARRRRQFIWRVRIPGIHDTCNVPAVPVHTAAAAVPAFSLLG